MIDYMVVSINTQQMKVICRENHQKFQWNKDRFMKWVASIGDNTSILVSKLFDRYKVEEQAYKGCMSLLKLIR